MFYLFFFFLMIRRPPRSTQSRSSAASDVYKRQGRSDLTRARGDVRLPSDAEVADGADSLGLDADVGAGADTARVRLAERLECARLHERITDTAGRGLAVLARGLDRSGLLDRSDPGNEAGRLLDCLDLLVELLDLGELRLNLGLLGVGQVAAVVGLRPVDNVLRRLECD